MSGDLLKIMIVDDEELVRGLFKVAVDWNRMGMEVASEASNASEALDLIEDIKPDIIFTDICMPFMDGLEFGKLVAERYPHIKIVVLTAYEEFDYAKKGIKIGLSDFLLKPINGSEIEKVALNLKKKIEEERRHNDEYNILKKKLSESYPYLLERFLNELLQGKEVSGNLNEKLAYFSLDKAVTYHRIAVIDTAFSEPHKEEDEENRLILGMRCDQLVKQYFKDDAGIFVFFDLSRRIVVLCNNPDINMDVCLEQLKAMLLNRLKCFVSIGVGNSCKDWSDISVSYKQACDALDYRVIAGWNQVVDFNDIGFNTGKTAVRNLDTDRIRMYIKSGAGDILAGFIDQIYSDICFTRQNDIEEIRITSSNMISAVINALHEMGIDYGKVFDRDRVPYADVFRIDNLPEAREYVKALAMNAAKIVRKMRSKKENSTIRLIMDYLKEHLAEKDLTLASVAGRFYKNPSYLSRIFKQETGQNFIEYLTKVRMEKAIELLSGTDMKSYEIAGAVGIQDPNYFSMCFKKFTGMSVNDYKRRVINPENSGKAVE